MSCEEFQDGCHGTNLGYRNRTNFSNSETPCRPNASHQLSAQSDLPFWSRCGLKIFKMTSRISEQNEFSNSKSPCYPMPSTEFQLNPTFHWQQITMEDFQDAHRGGHLGYRNKIMLAILNLLVAPVTPTKFWLNQIYHSAADEIWRFSIWPLWQPFWTLELNDFSNSESLCCSYVSNQVSAQSNLRFRRRCHLKNFKMATVAAILDIWTEQFINSESLIALVPPIKFPLNLIYGLGGDVVWRISRCSPWQLSWISEWNDFSYSDSLCLLNAYHQVSA